MRFRHSNWEYKGYTYQPSQDMEPDVVKTYHTVVSTQYGMDMGRDVPFSPYSLVSEEAFKAWIESGRPTKETLNKELGTIGNPSNEDLINYYIEVTLVK
jgi:hypothetical protein